MERNKIGQIKNWVFIALRQRISKWLGQKKKIMFTKYLFFSWHCHFNLLNFSWQCTVSFDECFKIMLYLRYYLHYKILFLIPTRVRKKGEAFKIIRVLSHTKKLLKKEKKFNRFGLLYLDRRPSSASPARC